MNDPAPTIPETISKDAINRQPLIRYEGKVVLVDKPSDVQSAIKALSNETILGFDTETRPSFTKGESFKPSLIQLAATGTVYLFQIKPMGGLTPLIPLLTNPDIVKAGVAIRDDIKGLQSLEPFTEAGFIEISDMTTRHGIVNTGLRALCALFLGGRISKKAQVSNWSRRHLTGSQINYAATDAWISREIYLKLLDLKFDSDRPIAPAGIEE